MSAQRPHDDFVNALQRTGPWHKANFFVRRKTRARRLREAEHRISQRLAPGKQTLQRHRPLIVHNADQIAVSLIGKQNRTTPVSDIARVRQSIQRLARRFMRLARIAHQRRAESEQQQSSGGKNTDERQGALCRKSLKQKRICQRCTDTNSHGQQHQHTTQGPSWRLIE